LELRCPCAGGLWVEWSYSIALAMFLLKIYLKIEVT
jgi:hypothetical protein